MGDIETRDDLFEAVSEEKRQTLERNKFDAEAFLALWKRYRDGQLDETSNRIHGEVRPPGPEDLDVLPGRESVEGRRLREIGREAIEAGKVGMVVLNGGMATRFGGVVKGCVDVFDGRSFLELKLRDAGQWGGEVDFLLMNSFSTDDTTREHLVDNDYFGVDSSNVFMFRQNVSIRVTPDGELFRTDDGDISLYAPGHGDLAEALNRGVLQRFIDRGGEYLMMSNVDNLLATLDPLVVGAHVRAADGSGVEMTVEAVRSDPGDSGGKPARVDGELEIVESFRFPEGFDWETIPVHNTNTFMFNAEALQRSFDLNWYVVDKEVEGRTAIQFERLAGELSAFLQTQCLSVPRQGARSRFLAVKTREDLEENRGFLKEVMADRNVI